MVRGKFRCVAKQYRARLHARESLDALVKHVPDQVAVQVLRSYAAEPAHPALEPPLVAVDRLHVVDPALPLPASSDHGHVLEIEGHCGGSRRQATKARGV